jgi:N-methylhydantoinase A
MTVSEMKIRELGGTNPMQVTLSHGGLSQIKHAKMVETAMSGPVGGVLGGSFIGDLYGIDNLITTDVGGTSFDVGLITNGKFLLNLEPEVGPYIINVPYADVSSIGAGGGTIAYVDSMSGRLKVGPRSAGADPGPACYGKGGENPTVTDADMVLGYLDPKYFLGGNVKVGKELSIKAIKDKISDPLGMSVEDAARGIKIIIDTQMDNYCRNLISCRGYAVDEYTLLAFGGAGPSHVAGYTQYTDYKDVLMFPYSSVFCAFGTATADFSHQYLRSTLVYIPATATDDLKAQAGKAITSIWEDLEKIAYEQLIDEGFTKDQIKFNHIAFVRYAGQLDDVVVHMPNSRMNTSADMDLFLKRFEEEYISIFSEVARVPEAGYQCMNAGLVAYVEKAKPKLVRHELSSEKPSSNAIKGQRDVIFDKGKEKTDIYELSELKSGNIIYGPTIIEHVNTNFVIPSDRHVRIDEYGTLWLKRGGK